MTRARLVPAILVLAASLTWGCKSKDGADSKETKDEPGPVETKKDPAPTEPAAKPDPAAASPSKTMVVSKTDSHFKTDVEIVVPAGFEFFTTPHEGGEADPAAIDLEGPGLKVHIEAAEKDHDIASYIKAQLDAPPESQTDNGKLGWELLFRDRLDKVPHYLIFNRELMLYCDGSPGTGEKAKADTRAICAGLSEKK